MSLLLSFAGCVLTLSPRQFCVALVVYSSLSLVFPAQETFIDEAITSEDVDDTPSDKSSQIEKGVDADVKVA